MTVMMEVRSDCPFSGPFEEPNLYHIHSNFPEAQQLMTLISSTTIMSTKMLGNFGPRIQNLSFQGPYYIFTIVSRPILHIYNSFKAHITYFTIVSRPTHILEGCKPIPKHVKLKDKFREQYQNHAYTAKLSWH
ncbi:hypothetical protein CEXT_388051 [Caerostris extrusa]|uniref:Uncharacterized protein n=1 Tax=Caerostris extrusa TaxID=172846 RepID=A0AAV4XFY6_CAEEX|nr:hypothetical protein CEXT_388051 [Caerostris extrusa]